VCDDIYEVDGGIYEGEVTWDGDGGQNRMLVCRAGEKDEQRTSTEKEDEHFRDVYGHRDKHGARVDTGI
jgi:hypothetical protein